MSLARWAVVFSFVFAPSVRADGGSRALVDPSIQYQTLQGWGTSLAWWGNVVGGFPEPVRSEYIRKVFDPVEGLGFNVVRYNIGGGENPLYHFMEYRAAVPGFEPSAGVWDWSADANQRWVLNAAIASGADAVEAFSNSPPYWMTNSGSVTGAVGGSDNLNATYYDAFADYLSEVVLHFRDEWGISFQTIEPLNEPVSGWWRFGGRQEGCHFDRGSEASIIQRLGASLASKGLSTAVSAPDENTIDLTLGSFRSYEATTRSLVSQINTHSYGGSQRTQLASDANSRAKALWMSEYGDGDATGLTMSRRILADMKHLRPSSWIYWQAVDGGGWGLLRNSLPDGTHTDYTLNKKYFVIANYSRFIRPGYRFIAITDPNSLAAYDPFSGTLIVVATNSASSDVSVTYDLTTFDGVDPVVTAYRTSADEDLAPLPPAYVVDGVFTSAAKAGSVTTYVFSGVAYCGPIGFDATSYYKLVNLNSGLLLDVSGGSLSDGAQLIQWPDHGGWNQQWLILGLGGGTYNLVNRNSGLILDVSNASPDDGANILQFHDHDAPNQQWSLIDLGDGTLQLLNSNSALLADVADGSTAAGARIVQYHDDGGASQRWILTPAQ